MSVKEFLEETGFHYDIEDEQYIVGFMAENMADTITIAEFCLNLGKRFPNLKVDVDETTKGDIIVCIEKDETDDENDEDYEGDEEESEEESDDE